MGIYFLGKKISILVLILRKLRRTKSEGCSFGIGLGGWFHFGMGVGLNALVSVCFESENGLIIYM